MTRRVAVFAAFALVAPVAAAAGQTVNDLTGTLVGSVTDQSGAVLPGVTVMISSPGLMGTLEMRTDAEGDYRFPALPPADYTIVFSRQGFATLTRTRVRVALGATATIDETMSVAPVEQSITIDGDSSVLDRRSASVAVRFDAAQLANLPGSRSMGAILSATPAVQMARVDVGGSAGLITGPSSTYGASFTPPRVEGIDIALINTFGLTLDYGSFREVSLTSAAHGPDEVTAGVRVQFITKAGGNRYHGSLYADYEDRRWQSFNIDQQQIDRVSAADPCRATPTACRAITTSTLTWAATSRRIVSGGTPRLVISVVSSRLVTFPVKPYRTEAWNLTVKSTYRVNARHNVIVVRQRHARSRLRIWLDGFGPAGGALTVTSAINRSEDSTSKRLSSGSIIKAEWNWAIGNSIACGSSGRPVCAAPGRDPQRRRTSIRKRHHLRSEGGQPRLGGDAETSATQRVSVLLQERLVRQPSTEARRRDYPIDGKPILEATPIPAMCSTWSSRTWPTRQSRWRCTCSIRPRDLRAVSGGTPVR